MIHNLYSIYDRKAGYFLPAFHVQSEADALRSFKDVIINSDTNVSKYPADYDLIQLGHINLISGMVEALTPTGLIINGLVALQEAEAERRRYQALLNPETPSPSES